MCSVIIASLAYLWGDHTDEQCLILYEYNGSRSFVLQQWTTWLFGITVSFYLIEDKSSIFHRIKCQNIVLKQINTDIMGVEVDAVMEILQIIEAVHQIRIDNCDFAFPYDGKCLDNYKVFRNCY